MNKMDLIKLINQYYPDSEDEIKDKNSIIEFLSNNDIFLGKGNTSGHITGSTWIVDKHKNKVLLTHHRKLGKWLQLGGHTEENENILDSALREAIEESGLTNLKVLSRDIFDVDVHLIPRRKNELEHYHYDIRFLIEADDTETIVISKESINLKWLPLSEIDLYSNEQSIKRMVKKTTGLIKE
ncbi:NUDIX hydrolase [Serpentinicella alkaliphila]|uniref:NUDIX domain-containing protein n=1 Tax=Serpentinicella alkaliphila TaxID=1734049 RepID=A0A4R2T2L8_9FIRM|nr:NUDIX hydrolase [Serpentinicella alkaliphila]QUH26538.1 NUDIX hydrolase [Serpentinicella alkaliphila]TCP96460.1 NUDIX domain-containing protein [Serpentinicella alkaliphila]